jgi:hypothetical protein
MHDRQRWKPHALAVLRCISDGSGRKRAGFASFSTLKKNLPDGHTLKTILFREFLHTVKAKTCMN